jgi:cell division protein FtsQ
VHTRAADIAAVAELDHDDNVLTLSPDTIESAAESLPWVKSARVQRRLPGTIRVELVERRPAMILTAPNGEWTIDPHGRVLAEGSAYSRLPTIASASPATFSPGDKVAAPQLRAVLAAAGVMPGGLRKRVEAAFAPTPQRISFSLRNGMSIRFGSANRAEDKIKVVTAILDRVSATGEMPAYIDVRVPESPAVSTTQLTPEVAPAPVPTPTP